MYVATTGYFNLQGDVTPATVWAMEMTFDNAGGYDLGGGALTGSYLVQVYGLIYHLMY